MASSVTTSDAATKRQTKRSHRTLASLLKYFEEMPLRVELKNGRIYSGTLTAADRNMALTLTDVVQTHPRTTKNSASAAAPNETPILQLLQIRGSTIRYIHFPDHVDWAAIIRAGIQREKEASNKYKRGVRKAPPAPL